MNLGRSEKLGLTGCPVQSVGLLSTSKLYVLHGKTMAFVPQFLDQQQFYLALDVNLLVDIFKHDVAYLRYNWREVGRPTLVMTVTHSMFENKQLQSALLATIRKVRTGYFNGVQVLMRSLSEFLSTACVNQLTFLETSGALESIVQSLEILNDNDSCPMPFLPNVTYVNPEVDPELEFISSAFQRSPPHPKSAVSGIIQQTRVIGRPYSKNAGIQNPI
ncbi:phosphorylase b kinase regulatory subunit alpha, liver isoform-like isoform X2 [Anneissia japonica]|uniref:phosphorylase b kinase regulatory subunit alpha, liver isoform-like isoform X2 n=1 Tax=Anneissia japonica TaxID=1529436 RepID=UPI001425B4C8|nr:phosphorylase b kinase regulatory subunit alpha, liver isoform-like isoform X2 [Anneissia japonica]